MNNEELLKEILQELQNISSKLEQLDYISDRLCEIAVDVSVMK